MSSNPSVAACSNRKAAQQTVLTRRSRAVSAVPWTRAEPSTCPWHLPKRLESRKGCNATRPVFLRQQRSSFYWIPVAAAAVAAAAERWTKTSSVAERQSERSGPREGGEAAGAAPLSTTVYPRVLQPARGRQAFGLRIPRGPAGLLRGFAL